METLPIEILREIGNRLDIKSIINLSQTSIQFSSNTQILPLLRERSLNLYPLLNDVDPQYIEDWKLVAILASIADGQLTKPTEPPNSRICLEKLLRLLGVPTEVKLEEQITNQETILNYLKDVPPIVTYTGLDWISYRAPVLYWICFHAKHYSRNKAAFDTTLEELLKDPRTVTLPALAEEGRIDWPIFAAVKQEWMEGVKRLFQVPNIDVNVTSNIAIEHVLQMSPLQYVIVRLTHSSQFGRFDRVKDKWLDGVPERLIAARSQGLDMMKLLLTRADPTLAKAVIRNGLKSGYYVNRLLTEDSGAEESGITALHLACYSQLYGTWIDAIKVLIEAGADVNAQTNPTKLTPLHMLFANIHHMKVRLANEFWSEELELSHLRAVVELFLAHGADLSLCTTEGMNVIHYALVAHKRMSFDESIIIIMQQHCARAASESLPWSVCLRCDQRYDVSANDKSACVTHKGLFNDDSQYNHLYNDAPTYRWTCCDALHDDPGCVVKAHK